MLTTVVGSFAVELNEANSFSEKLKSIFGLYDPYKIAIEESVKLQLEAGIDIVADGQVRGDMVGSFVKFIPGFSFEKNSSVIHSKIRTPQTDITVKDVKYASSVLDNELKNSSLSSSEIAKKGVKGMITGPSTIVHSSRIESFYKDKNEAIIDLANALSSEMKAIVNSGAKYIQIDEPFLSTGMVDMKTARKAISILSKDIEIPVAMHVCGNLTTVFKDLATFNVDILDCEFAGNDVNIKILEDNANLLNGKKIGFGCLDTTLNDVDSEDKIKSLIQRGIDAVGKDNIILDPDCGLKKVDISIAVDKLKLMVKIANEFN